MISPSEQFWETISHSVPGKNTAAAVQRISRIGE
jgi:hypothetical protein